MPKIALTILVLLCFSQALLAQDSTGIEIDKRDVVVKYRKFNPKNPPSEMPPLEPPEAAVARSMFGVETGIHAQSDGNTITVEKITAKLSLEVVIWLPTDSTPAIKEHEDGHKRISEMFYEDAEKALRKAAEPFVGKRVSNPKGSNAALSDINSQIGQKYMAATHVPAAEVNKLFDVITDHGQKKIAVDKAIKQSLERYRKRTTQK